MTTLQALQTLDPPTVTVVALAAAALALVATEPVRGRRGHRTFLAELARETTPAARESVRVRHYRRWTVQGWSTALVAVLLVLVLPGVGVADLGLRGGGLDGLLAAGSASGGSDGSIVVGFLIGVTIAVAGSTLLVRALGRRAGRTPIAGAAAVEPMLPRSGRGRLGWAGLALTAGVTEEVTFRGLLLLTIALLVPGGDRTATLVAAAVLFGLAHWYQGPVGMLATGVVGGVLGGLYLSTGSLVVPMVLHVLLDLRPLLLGTPADTATQPPGEPTTVEPSHDAVPAS